LPLTHHKHLKSTDMLERLNEEIKRRTDLVRIFPNGDSCLRLIRALAVEIHEVWREAHRYLSMEDLREPREQQLRLAARDDLWTTPPRCPQGPPHPQP
jgi:transposase-like protein